MSASYATPPGGLPPQTQLTTSRAQVQNSFAVIPRGVMRDIVTSSLPGWTGARAWVLARPLTGFAETFAQLIVELAPDGGSDAPEPEAMGQGVIFVTSGDIRLNIAGQDHALTPGGYAYLPPGCDWKIRNSGTGAATFHWIRKAYDPAPGLDAPAAFVTHEADIPITYMPDTDRAWGTQRFVGADDLRHDMQVNIVTFAPGGCIPFPETHVMEHGLYVLEGKAVYLLNQSWVEVEAGDFIWLRAFCPQACYAGGPGQFRYLLYKDVNRHPKLTPG
ncbi:(S)-ureidoglycine aminohydrolase [Rhodophyticola sp. CCM32]|uniref:bifunctional allantoicase/(S)-ureidoglycine aminohydrolase n=1 Tax=Rhodophyticola sp. CCM32 TaxID=2916397 RepID=UPI00107F798D|nr:bifunctional allantoicase/(S)-ureidoglycine aminohydrolase [Rhodophyticola sp. CCM32]QBY00327.1 (S)-ureidoglycine aminohydrolase [Rhodophyticola sp. CCM32]